MAKRRKKQPWESASFSDPAFRPYTTALGQIALAWNGLHSSMAVVFCTIMGGGFSNQYLAIWHAIPNDRAQRAVLVAAARDSFGYDSALGKRVYEEMVWLTGQCNSIEEARNNALHSPLWGYRRGEKQTIIMPVTGLGHERAKKLQAAKAGLLAEFRWCRDAALGLTDFLADLDDHLTGRRRIPWPDRPRLPLRQGSNKTSSQTHQKPARERQPRPRSSPPTAPRTEGNGKLKD